jgi:hypothetical protein
MPLQRRPGAALSPRGLIGRRSFHPKEERMKAILLPDIDLDALRKAIPALADLDVPSMEEAGRKADETIDRLLGRSRMPVWPWLVIGAVLVAVIGSIAAVFSLNRRSGWTPDDEPVPTPDVAAGITPTESSLMSTSIEDRLV